MCSQNEALAILQRNVLCRSKCRSFAADVAVGGIFVCYVPGDKVSLTHFRGGTDIKEYVTPASRAAKILSDLGLIPESIYI